VYVCTIPEIRTHFAAGNVTSKRARLLRALEDHLASAVARQNVAHILIDGSFVGSKPDPGDVDIVVGLRQGTLAALKGKGHGIQAAAMIEALEGRFTPTIDNKRAIHGFVDEVGGPIYNRYFRYFQQSTRMTEPASKGILRVDI